MYFKFLLMSLIVMLSSCSWWGADEGNKRQVGITEIDSIIQGSSGECLSEIDDFFVKFFKGFSTVTDIRKIESCVEESVDLIFEKLLERDQKVGFSKEELIKILSKIWSEKEPSEIKNNVDILFLVKRLLVGGTQAGFSRLDYKRFQEQLPLLRDVLISANGHIKYWLFDLDVDLEVRTASLDEVEKAVRKLDFLRKKFKSSFNKQESYELLSFIFGSKTLKKFQSLVFLASDMAFGDAKAFEFTQKNIFQRIHAVLKMQSMIRSGKFGRNIFLGNSMPNIFAEVDELFLTLKSWSDQDENYAIRTDLIGKVMSEAFENTKKSRENHPIASAFQNFIEKYFETKELRTPHFVKLTDVIRSWYYGQKMIFNQYKPAEAVGNFDQFRFSGEQQKEALDILTILKQTEHSYFRKNTDDTTQYIYLRQGRKNLSSDENYFDWSLKNLFAHLSMRAAEVYFKDFGGFSVEKINASMDRLNKLMLDIRPLALDMGIANPYTCTAAQSYMTAANLFTVSGNGDENLSFLEGVELVFMSYSASNLSTKVHNSIGESCNLEGKKFLNNAFLDRQCVRKSIFGKTNALLGNFPEFLKYYGIIENSTSNKDWNHRLGWAGVLPWYVEDSNIEVLQEIMFKILNGCTETDAPMTKQELQSIVGLTQYVENWFSMYDITGQRSLWGAYFSDPDELDYVIDGRELSNLFDEKLEFLFNKNFVQYESDFWRGTLGSIKRGLVSGWLQRTESGEALDRYRAFTLLDSFLNDPEQLKIHKFQKLFCSNIVNSYRSKKPIDYNDSLFLRCDGSDKSLRQENYLSK